MPRGGKRIGSGKKPGKHGVKVDFTLKLTPDVTEYLRTVHAAGASKHIDDSIRKQKDFRDWIASRNGE